jgi:heat shock protein HslJ
MRMFLPLGLAAALAACLPHPPPAQAPYRAIGTEPGWSLLIDERQLTFIHMDGTQVRQPRPQVINGVAGEIYQTPRINVNIVHAQCNDGMSDRIYRDKVQVRVDGRAFEGCGGEAVAPATVAGTSWQVVAINGRPTPAAGNYFMNFESNDRIGARFGCNSIGGGYLQRSGTISMRNLAVTRMACAEPAMSFENQGLGILSQPVIASWTGGDRLTLSNPSGRIELARSY